MLNEKILARKLPCLMTLNDGKAVKTIDDWRIRRKELLDVLSREEYGYTPAAPESVAVKEISSERSFAGKAIWKKLELTIEAPLGSFTFPFNLITPIGVKGAPAFIHINFRPDVPDKYMPVEEIIDNGFALASFYYEDVSSDSGNFNGIAEVYPRDEKTGWGKLGMWAFAASRILDYLVTCDEIDPERVAVTGHSRLGKTALWCAAQDERFSMGISNDSGCSGAAVSRDKVGEHVDRIATVFPFWFCGNYQNWKNREHEMPFDQHMLISLIAPRCAYIDSAEEDEWADPESEFLSAVTASEAWKLHRLNGVVTPDAMPEYNMPLHEGGVGYHVRTGSHFYSRTDWLFQMAYRKKHNV